MPNVTTLTNLKAQIPYQPDGFQWAISEIEAFAGRLEEVSDALSLFNSIEVSTTATAVKAAAGKVYMVIVKSRGTAGFVSLWNVAAGGVTVGTTSQDVVVPVSSQSGELTAVKFFGNNLGRHFGTAITVAAATTARGNSAMTNLPQIWVLYA